MRRWRKDVTTAVKKKKQEYATYIHPLLSRGSVVCFAALGVGDIGRSWISSCLP